MSLLESIREEPSLPRSNGELTFNAPWESRAFSVAVAMAQSGAYDWDAFRERLIAEIDAWTRSRGQESDGGWDYYQRWLSALERLLIEQRILTAAELDAARAQAAYVAAHDH